MKKITTHQSKQLSDIEIKKLRDLYGFVTHADECAPKIYWHSIESRGGDRFQDFTMHAGEEIIAYVGWFDFEDDALEFCAFVHPAYRYQGRFTALFDRAKKNINKSEKPELQAYHFLLHSKQTVAANFLKEQGAVPLKEECHYAIDRHSLIDRYRPNDPSVLTKLVVRQAIRVDIPVLASIDEDCFSEHYDDALLHHSATIDDPQRMVWLMFAERVPVAKIHVKITEDKAVIHNFSVVSNFQNKGYGKYLLIYVVKSLFSIEHIEQIIVEFDADNTAAQKVYEAIGFACIDRYTVMRIPVA